MKIMCDTNIILDVMLEREPFAESSANVLRLCENHYIDGFVSASSITDIFYLVRKHTHSNESAYNAVGKVLEIVRVCNVTNNEVLKAYQIKAKDFEDCLLAVCAESSGCDYIVTRNIKDFENLPVPAITPAEFLELIK
ncbi:MAG: PIN domain-containing protein [Ruminococcus flavefaciens]|nr:PIN domain-containing protein [Ruminococcus flavefaciens]MCM1231202.1 PIN domain-containing protein [Ruminococcus flavefaciens]